MTGPEAPPTRPVGASPVILLLSIVVVLVVLRVAWMSGDAFVDLRVVDNVLRGYGPRWNVVERVQAFTDPLWVLALVLAHAVITDAYLACLGLSVALTIGALVLLTTRVATDSAGVAIGLLLLAFSKTCVEYSTSGFATPLAHLLLVGFAALCCGVSERRHMLRGMTTVASLLALTAPMGTLIVLPALVVALATSRPFRPAVSAVAVGAWPVVAWEAFAWIYYGFPLPNPAYAAYHDWWTWRSNMADGPSYFINAVAADPLTVVAIVLAVLAGRFSTDRTARSLAAGTGLYLVALFVGGGDTSLRSLSAPIMAATIIVTRLSWQRLGGAALVPATLVVALGLLTPGAPLRTDATYGHDVRREDTFPFRDERRLAYQAFGLLRRQRSIEIPDTWSADQEVEKLLAAGETVVVRGDAPFFGFVAGSRLFVIDPTGRTDPLLARLRPARSEPHADHRRAIPEGYVETLQTGQNRVRDPTLHEYYAGLRRVIRAPLLSQRRFQAMTTKLFQTAPELTR